MTAGQYLKAARIKLGFTQKHVADYLNVSEVTVSYWESDHRRPRLSKIKRIKKILNWSSLQCYFFIERLSGLLE